jgi:hypothetical protein
MAMPAITDIAPEVHQKRKCHFYHTTTRAGLSVKQLWGNGSAKICVRRHFRTLDADTECSHKSQ